ncbi:MAG: tetratricopeptide repeat protein [Acidobacteria bacterium]|nr:tetratricopeptide repeat protein [Acidobacteriota bacterium]MBI3426285.1 tetratricopeptide repeat protein [Acidobacteriota bacterium]
MTVIYCGSCGAANGAKARFCRQCGIDLNGQTAKPAATQSSLKSSTSATSSNQAATGRAASGRAAASASSPSKPQLRIVTASTPPARSAEKETAQKSAEQGKARTGELPKAGTAEMQVPLQTPAESTGQMREAKRIEQLQEEDARQIKQAVSSTLSQRLAQAAGQSETGVGGGARNSGALNAAPRVRTAPLPRNAGRNSGALSSLVSNTGKLSMSASSAVAEASGLREHPQAGFYIRMAAAVLGLLLLGSGVYFYRNQRAQQLNAGAQQRNLLSTDDEVVKLVQVAEQARQTGQMEQAAENLNKAIELKPDQTEPRQLLAETLESSGRPDDALRAYDGLLKISPENLSARLKVADLHRAKGNVNEARSQYQRIISLNHNSPEASRALEAIEEIEGTLGLNALASSTPFPTRPRRVAGQKRVGPVLPPSATNRSQVALVAQNPFAAPGARAALNWNPVRPLEPPDPHVAASHHKELGLRYMNIREFSAAVAELQQAVKLTPGDKDLYYFLGSSYRGLGQPGKAYEYYKKCDSGIYAGTSQSGARDTEKAARKENERQQKELLNSVQADKTKQPEARKENAAGKGYQNSFQEP